MTPTAGEVLLGATYLGLHAMPLVLVYSMGGSLDPIDDYRAFYYSLIGAGYLAGFVTLFVSAARGCPRALAPFFWLVTHHIEDLGSENPGASTVRPLAGRVPVCFHSGRWNALLSTPDSPKKLDAHGFGASGGEANSLFLPWLHYGIWLLLLLRQKKRERLLRETNSSAGTSSEGSS